MSMPMIILLSLACGLVAVLAVALFAREPVIKNQIQGADCLHSAPMQPIYAHACVETETGKICFLELGTMTEEQKDSINATEGLRLARVQITECHEAVPPNEGTPK